MVDEHKNGNKGKSSDEWSGDGPLDLPEEYSIDGKPAVSTLDRIIRTEVFRRDVAAVLNVSANSNAERIRLLNTLDWNDQNVKDPVARHYFTEVARSLHDSSLPEQALTISWGSPETEPDPKNPDIEIIKRPQLRIMVQNEYEPEDRAENPNLPPTRYLLTYTPANIEETPSLQTQEFMQKLHATITNDFDIPVESPMPHTLTKKPTLLIDSSGSEEIYAQEENDTNPAHITIPVKDEMGNQVASLSGTNLYSRNEGISLDIAVNEKELIDGFKEVVSKGTKEIRHKPRWAQFAEEHNAAKSNQPELGA